MGASQSKSEPEEQVFYSETPIQFSDDVVNQLADNSASSTPSPARQSTLDSHIRSRIQDELTRLRQEEESIKQEIEHALEKENLDRERELAGEESATEDDAQAAGGVKSSAAMIGDLEDLKHKVDRYQKRRDDSSVSDLQAKSLAVVNCYRSNTTTSLDCWKEVNNFKLSVVEVEQHYVDSLRS
ncbi:hypothetical protein EUX98_g6555 [Antrodiella citrinella]|uniref:DUF1690 domain-containing protein n=1 Tax=Antrodiella citrinella TaxID=2447956 RepID=A0A4S4MNU6_9APHY|nr:hypothetical protein EUX98_g6555 [Antrodiella citrinella]